MPADDVRLILPRPVAEALEAWLEDDAEVFLQRHGSWADTSNAEWLPGPVALVLCKLYDHTGWPPAFNTTRQRAIKQAAKDGKTKFDEWSAAREAAAVKQAAESK